MIVMDYSINSRPLLEDSENSESEEFLTNEINSHSILNDHTVVVDGQQLLIKRAPNAPIDKYNFSYIVFYLLGVTSLIPWNFIMTAENYWLYKFRNTTSNTTTHLTPIQAEFTSNLSVASAVPNTLFLILNAFMSHRIPLAIRMIFSIVTILILFIVTTIFVEINTDNWQNTFFKITIVTVILMNISSAILAGGLFGIAGQFPSEYITAVVSGQALGGIFAAVCEIISLTFGASPSTTGFVYFMVGNLVLLLSLVCYIIMSKTIYFKYYTFDKSVTIKKKITFNNSIEQQQQQNQIQQTQLQPEILEPNFKIVLSKIWIYGFSEWLVFVITLSVYPSVTVLIDSEYKGNGHPWNDVYFTVVVNYLVFNSGDYLGRILAGMIEWPRNSPNLIACVTILRVVFIPILLLCNEMPRHNLPVIIHSDIILILIMCIFSFSNGYIANICLIWAPKTVCDHEKEMASSMMAAFLGIGLACGSAISVIFVNVI